MKPARIVVALGITLSVGAHVAGQARFEVTSIRSVRPTLVNTIAALKKGDVAAAREAFEAYDIGWNGIEVYINTRDRAMYNELEKNYQTKIEEGLTAAKPDTAAILSNAQAMLAKYDEAIAAIEKAAPLSPLYDDIARLRTARSPLRIVNPAMKEGDVARARKMVAAFHANWPGISAYVRMRSADAAAAVEKNTGDLDA